MLLAVASALALAAAPATEPPAAPPADDPAAGAPATDPPATGTATAIPPTAAPPPTAAEARPSWYALPVLFWLPETRLGFGATGGVHLPRPGAPRPTSLFAAAVYTLQEQFTVDVGADAYTRGGARLVARLRAFDFPDVFYGIGPDTPTSAREPFTRVGAELVASLQLPVTFWGSGRPPGDRPALGVLRVGPRVDLRIEDIRDLAPGQALEAGTVPGASGYAAAAGGATVTWDTRDSTFWPRRGTFAEGWYVYAPAALGRNSGFGRGVVDARRFLPLGARTVLGLQAYGEACHGATPFTLYPSIGSNGFLRGIREGRYRDRVDWAAQAELRQEVVGRLSAAAFAALGDVAPSPADLTLRHPKVAGGAGLRWRLTDQGVNVRVDGAISQLGPELYVLVLEAF